MLAGQELDGSANEGLAGPREAGMTDVCAIGSHLVLSCHFSLDSR